MSGPICLEVQRLFPWENLHPRSPVRLLFDRLKAQGSSRTQAPVRQTILFRVDLTPRAFAARSGGFLGDGDGGFGETVGGIR